MYAATLLADPTCLRLERIISSAISLTLVVRIIGPTAACPRCGAMSGRVHSRYRRRVAGLPWHGVAARLELHARKFFCVGLDCPQRVFTERLPRVVAPHARRTRRLNEALTLLAFALGGEAGARAASGLGMAAGADTLLARIRGAAPPERPTPSVLGVDDWAKRRGQHYGTILVDLERRRPVELLPDREAATLAAWLRTQPGVEVISRDRGGAYAEGAREGAPTAVQVADRWHLLKNLSEALERLLTRKHHLVAQAARGVTVEPAPHITPAARERERSPVAAPAPTRAERERVERRARHLACYAEATQMRQHGAKLREVAQRVGVSTRTLRRWALRGSYPEPADYKRRSILDPFLPYLARRWSEGCHNALGLWRELRAQGFRGSEEIVRYHLSRRRAQLPVESRYSRGVRAPRPQPLAPPSPRRAGWMLLRAEEEPKVEHRAFIEGLHELCPEVEMAGRLAREFSRMVKGRCAGALAGWLDEAESSGVAEFEGFAAGLRRDGEAVMAALSSEWSNGQTEGQINRLKTIKRQMYGRANFDPLRARVLHTAQA
jgi:transposase